MLVLAALTFAALVTSLVMDNEADIYPSASRIALRINHNITSAYLSTQEYFKGDQAQTPEEILQVYDRALGYVRVSLDGGEIDGVPVLALQDPVMHSEMQEIGNVIGKLKSTTTDFLSLDNVSGEAAEFDFLFDAQYEELQDLIKSFSSSSRGFLKRYGDSFRFVQLCLMSLAMLFVLVILINSKKVYEEKSAALTLVGKIEERRKLAIEGANLGTWDWDLATGEVTFNNRWADMLGLELDTVETSYKAWEKLVHPDDLPKVLQELKAHLSGKTPRLSVEYRMWAQPGHWIWILDLGKVLERDADGKPLRAAGTHLNITNQKTSELKLLSEKAKAQQYLDLAGVLFVALDTKGIVTMINPKGCQVLGLPADYIVGRDWMKNFVPKRIRDDIQTVASNLLDMEFQGSEYHVNPIMTASGEEVLIAWRNTVLFDDEDNIIGHLSSGMDITKQHRHELALEKYRRRLQSLASQLSITEDRLRQDIASGLHDSIGQNLAALKLSIDLIGLNLASPDNLDLQAVGNDLEKASKTIDQIVKETWSLSFQLSPPGLYESGIGSALEWLVTKFNEKYSCNFVLKVHEHPMPREKDGRGLLFQMVRELMINAVKNGQATEVEISLGGAGSAILVTVTDNGSGFDTTAVLDEDGDVGGFGLFSISERLAYISGSLEIDSTVGQGSRVAIRFPVATIDYSEMESSGEN